MTARTFILSALATFTIVSSAVANERIDLTPTLYRDQARATAAVRLASELTTTPRLVPVAPVAPRILVEATAR